MACQSPCDSLGEIGRSFRSYAVWCPVENPHVSTRRKQVRCLLALRARVALFRLEPQLSKPRQALRRRDASQQPLHQVRMPAAPGDGEGLRRSQAGEVQLEHVEPILDV